MIYLDLPYSPFTNGRATAPVELKIGEALEFSELRTLAAVFEDGLDRDTLTLYNVRFLSVSYLNNYIAIGF